MGLRDISLFLCEVILVHSAPLYFNTGQQSIGRDTIIWMFLQASPDQTQQGMAVLVGIELATSDWGDRVVAIMYSLFRGNRVVGVVYFVHKE